MSPSGSTLPVATAEFALEKDVSSNSRDASVSSTRSLSSCEDSPSPKTPLKSETVYFDKTGKSPPLTVTSFKCPDPRCGTWLHSVDACDKHSRTKHAKPHRCGLQGCDQSFADKRSLLRHRGTRKHRSESTSVFTCHCSASRPRWDKFKEHLRRCTAVLTESSTYTCCCGEAFRDAAGLEGHKLATHTEKPGRPRKRREAADEGL